MLRITHTLDASAAFARSIELQLGNLNTQFGSVPSYWTSAGDLVRKSRVVTYATLGSSDGEKWQTSSKYVKKVVPGKKKAAVVKWVKVSKGSRTLRARKNEQTYPSLIRKTGWSINETNAATPLSCDYGTRTRVAEWLDAGRADMPARSLNSVSPTLVRDLSSALDVYCDALVQRASEVA